jgi:hypothetical protein
MKPRRMVLAGNATERGEIIYAYRIIVGTKQLETLRVDEKKLWTRKLKK